MVERFTRQEIVGRLKREIEKGQAVFDAFAGTGISAKFAEAGGADMITTHILARFRMAGLLGADPTRNMDYFLDEIIAAGFSGILNCPTLALIDGNFRKTLEETGVTYDKEVEMMAIAYRKGLYTKTFCTTPEETQKMLEAGCDNIIAHGGNTSGGSIGSKTVTSLDRIVTLVQEIIDTVKRKKSDVIVTCHGGATETAQDVKYLLEKVKGLDGYVGGSTAERIPVEKSITEAVRGFKNIQLREKTRWK